MDIDTHSHSSRRQRIVSVKRARSPEPSSPQDRPSKRLSINVGHPNPYPYPNIRRRFGGHSAGSSRHSSEDWVQQTGGLTIDSPVLAGSIFPSGQEGAQGVQKDEDMMIESQEHHLQDSMTGSDRQQLPLLQTPSYPSSFTSDGAPPNLDVPLGQNQLSIPSITVDSSGYTPFQRTTLPFVAREEHNPQRSLLGPCPIMGPSLNVGSPTPMEHQVLQDCQRINSPLALNSRGSLITVGTSSPRLNMPRKHPRFMMGPRVDCEKCRLGIKGHFVHLE